MRPFNSVLVVCVGNLCRSPTGQFLVERGLANTRVSSAGLMARADQSACSVAIEVAAENKLDITSHRATRLSESLILSNDLILAMDKEQKSAIENMSPVAKGKVMLFGKWQHELEIPDPYKRSRETYQIVFQQLETNASLWAEKLEAN